MKKLFRLFLFLLLLSTFCAAALAAPKTYETEGLFVMSGNDDQAQAKDFALQDAKRLALEQAGPSLRKITPADKGVTKEDFASLAYGVMKLEKIITAEFDKDIMSFVVRARFTLDIDEAQKAIANLREAGGLQKKIRQNADLQKRYNDLLAENNKLKTELSKTKDQKIKDQLLAKTKETDNNLAATWWLAKGIDASDAKNSDGALEACGKALELDPKYAWAYNLRGDAYYNKGQYDLAIADFNKALELDHKYAWVYNFRGDCYVNKGQGEAAIADFGKAIELNPQFVPAYFNRGCAYMNKSQDDLAIADFTKALELSPQDVGVYSLRGISYSKKGQYDLAIADYSKVIALKPQNAVAYNNRGNAYYKKGQYDLALADYNKALEIDPQDAMYKNNRDKILQLVKK